MTATPPNPEDKNAGEKSRARALRAQIDGDALLKRLQDFALGDLPEEIVVSKAQIDTLKFLVDKVMPKVAEDAGPQDPNGPSGRPIIFNLSWAGEAMPRLEIGPPMLEHAPNET